mmetsp:Transcript_37497/g.74405  ORF Transcript_37497/g.74405 Transcript_37497/m.74405 type:complete len:230 (+) Transcript_37497:390-1079(+)
MLRHLLLAHLLPAVTHGLCILEGCIGLSLCVAGLVLSSTLFLAVIGTFGLRFLRRSLLFLITVLHLALGEAGRRNGGKNKIHLGYPCSLTLCFNALLVALRLALFFNLRCHILVLSHHPGCWDIWAVALMALLPGSRTVKFHSIDFFQVVSLGVTFTLEMVIHFHAFLITIVPLDHCDAPSVSTTLPTFFLATGDNVAACCLEVLHIPRLRLCLESSDLAALQFAAFEL